MQNPSGCAVGTISRQLVFTGTGSAPSFITQESTGIVRVATNQVSDIGNYSYKILATDSLTNLKNESNEFAITVTDANRATDLILDATTTFADQTYLVGTTEKLLDVPTYTVEPSGA